LALIQSMTGFGRAQRQSDHYTVTVEIKSVNNRFRDIRFKMASQLSSLEIPLKNYLSEMFTRGSFDIYINTKMTDKNSSIDEYDFEKIDAFIVKLNGLAKKNGVVLNFSPVDFMRPEFSKDSDEERQQQLQQMVGVTFKDACEALKQSRLSEGEKLVTVLKEHKAEYEKLYQSIIPHVSKHEPLVRERLAKKMAENADKIKIEESRFLQEVVYYLEKLDIHEEINRIKGHLQKLEVVLNAKGEAGRQIDFLLQELGRETNTIGSKSAQEEISNSVVSMKVQLEKIREQALNIE